MATDLFSDQDGLINESGVIACEVDTGQTVKIGDLVYASTHVAQGLPKITPCGADQDTAIGVVVGLAEGQSGAATKIVSVAVLGSGKVVKVVSNGTTTVGVAQKCAANAKVTNLDPTADEFDEMVGRALQTASADGDELLLLL